MTSSAPGADFRQEPGLQQGIDLFNAGEFWEAHEAWEGAWMPHRKEPGSDFFKGLIQVAAGWHHYGKRNRSGALIKWGTGADYLRPFLPSAHGVDVQPLVAQTDAARDRLGAADWVDLTPPRLSTATKA